MRGWGLSGVGWRIVANRSLKSLISFIFITFCMNLLGKKIPKFARSALMTNMVVFSTHRDTHNILGVHIPEI